MNNLLNALVQRIRREADYREAQPAFLSIYRSEQCYGGPEEGGWWYDVETLEGSKAFPSREAAEQWLEAAKAEVERINRTEAPARARAMARLPDCDEEPLPDAGEGYIPTGWGDGGKLRVVIEERMGEADTSMQPAPHYE